jgi:hypothetical protein
VGLNLGEPQLVGPVIAADRDPSASIDSPRNRSTARARPVAHLGEGDLLRGET